MESRWNYSMRKDSGLDLLEFLPAHCIYLSYTDDSLVHCKLFEVQENNLLRALALQVAARIEHFQSKFFNINIRDLGQFPCRRLIQRCAGRGTEHQRIGNNRGAQ